MNSTNLQAALQHKIDQKTKPLGSLGQLERLALQLGLIQNTLHPRIEDPTMLVFAADHGLADAGVSPYPKEVTWQMVMNFVGGGAAINVFCRINQMQLQVVNAGVDYDFPAELPIVDACVARGTRNMLQEPAMTHQECLQAMDRGARLVADLAKQGCNTVGFGEMGIGNTSASSLLMHHILQLPLESCVGAGAGMHGDALQHKLKILQTVARKYQPQDALDTLACFGGLEIAMMVGAALEAYRQRMVILVDGFIASAAILVASQMEPALPQNCIFCHCSHEQGHRHILAHFKTEALLKLDLRLGEGTGAALALPLVRAAAAFLNEMASFEDAGVNNQSTC